MLLFAAVRISRRHNQFGEWKGSITGCNQLSPPAPVGLVATARNSFDSMPPSKTSAGSVAAGATKFALAASVERLLLAAAISAQTVIGIGAIERRLVRAIV